MVPRMGKKKALIAIANLLLRLIYHLLKNKNTYEEMQNTKTEIKSSLEAANSRIQEAEEQIREVEDKLVEITDVEQKREKRLKINEVLREHWDVKCTNIRIIRVAEGWRERKGQKKYLKR